jgi:hypothetical protein
MNNGSMQSAWETHTLNSLFSQLITDLSGQSAVGRPIDKLLAIIMKTFKANKVAVIKNSHTAAEKREIEEEFIRKDTVKYSLKELLKAQSAKKAKA